MPNIPEFQFDIFFCPAYPSSDTKMTYRSCVLKQKMIFDTIEAGLGFDSIECAAPEACILCAIGKEACRSLHEKYLFTGKKFTILRQGLKKHKSKDDTTLPTANNHAVKMMNQMCKWPECTNRINGFGLCNNHSSRRTKNTLITINTGGMSKQDFSDFMSRYLTLVEMSGIGVDNLDALNMALFEEGMLQLEKRIDNKTKRGQS